MARYNLLNKVCSFNLVSLSQCFSLELRNDLNIFSHSGIVKNVDLLRLIFQLVK